MESPPPPASSSDSDADARSRSRLFRPAPGRLNAAPPPSSSEELAPLNPLCIIHILEKILDFLPLSDLKSARRVNRFWWRASKPSWSSKTVYRFLDIHRLRDFLARTVDMTLLLPNPVKNWIFEGETLAKLMNDEGLAEQANMTRQNYWACMEHLTFQNWKRERFRYEQFIPDPINQPYIRDYRRVTYYELSKIGSAYAVRDLFNHCQNNVKVLEIHFPLLILMKGAYIGPNQFPIVERLHTLKIFWQGNRWNDQDGVGGEEQLSEIQKLLQNIKMADIYPDDPQDRHLPQDKSGGNILILRLLQNAPNLKRIEVNGNSLLTSRIETWFLRHLLHCQVVLPSLMELMYSIPVIDFCSTALQKKRWPLKSLHLRIMPGEIYRMEGGSLKRLLQNFRSSLKHLELVFMGTCDATMGVILGEPDVIQGSNLESIELWGYIGQSYAWLRRAKMLRRAVIGAITEERWINLQGIIEKDGLMPLVVKKKEKGGVGGGEEVGGRRQYEEGGAFRGLQIHLKSNLDWKLRVDQGPFDPFKK